MAYLLASKTTEGYRFLTSRFSGGRMAYRMTDNHEMALTFASAAQAMADAIHADGVEASSLVALTSSEVKALVN